MNISLFRAGLSQLMVTMVCCTEVHSDIGPLSGTPRGGGFTAALTLQSVHEDGLVVNKRSLHNYDMQSLIGADTKIGLALGGGAAKGLAHIGVLKALEEAGIRVDYIAGSSMGALVGAAYAAGIPVDSLENVALRTDWQDMVSLLDPTWIKPGIIDGDLIQEFLVGRFYGDLKIQDLQLPFAATAVDISSGQEYVIRRGSLTEAVRTSISIPAILTPRMYADLYLVDGGIVDPVPIRVVRSMGAEFVIAVNVLVPPVGNGQKGELPAIDADDIQSIGLATFLTGWRKDEKKGRPPSLIEITHEFINISQARIAQSQIERLKPDVIIEPSTSDIRFWDFHLGREAIKLGYEATREALDKFKMK